MLREEISYRRAVPTDADELAAFGSASFVEAFGNTVNPGDLALHVVRTYSPELQRRELADPLVWQLLAAREAEIIGAALLRWAPPPGQLGPELRWAKIGRFYVGRMYWQTGVSVDLMLAALRSIRENGGKAVWLQVWEQAERAIRFYRKWGFLKIAEAPFRLGSELQRDLIMARSLRPT